MCALRQPASPLTEKGVVFIMSKAGKKSSRTAIQKAQRGEGLEWHGVKNQNQK